MIKEPDLQQALDDEWPVEIPEMWRTDAHGNPQPDWEAIVREQGARR